MQGFIANMERTEMLITAMGKIKTYNWIYQQKALEKNLEFGYTVQRVQDKELRKIEKSCAEHAILSLSTNFEVYYKDLVQELLYKYPGFFKNIKVKYQEKILNMLFSKMRYDYDMIAQELGLKNRFDVYTFFKEYGITFLTLDEKKIIEHIFTIRNSYVHNAGRRDKKTKKKLKKYPSPTMEGYLTTEAKRLRTKFKRLIIKVYDRVLKEFEEKMKNSVDTQKA